MVLEVGAFGRLLGHEGEHLMNTINALKKRSQRAPLIFHVRTQQKNGYIKKRNWALTRR